MERPPRQGEERGGRRGSPQALTGGVSAPPIVARVSGMGEWAERFFRFGCHIRPLVRCPYEPSPPRWGGGARRRGVHSGDDVLPDCRLRCVERSVASGSLSGGLSGVASA